LDTDHNIVGYFWDFDDGTNSTEQNPVHMFKKEGIYEVRLAVNDGQYTDSDTITVIVLEAETEGGELAVTLSMILFIILVVIIVVIMAFIRRMRQVFL
jgi:PKD repeat protein